jgi:DNA-binding NarL/FixJ family response regulator
MIKVLLADDHPMWCDHVAALIDAEKDMEVIARANSGVEALTKATESHPDVLLLDIAFPDVSGIQVFKLLLSKSPQTKQIILSAHVDYGLATTLLKKGAAGCMSKTCTPAEILEAIRVVMKNNAPAYLNKGLWEDHLRLAGTFELNVLTNPTEREWDVLTLIGLGFDYHKIAKKLSIAEDTVMNHRINGMKKLGLTSDAALTKLLIRLGRISAFEGVD